MEDELNWSDGVTMVTGVGVTGEWPLMTADGSSVGLNCTASSTSSFQTSNPSMSVGSVIVYGHSVEAFQWFACKEWSLYAPTFENYSNFVAQNYSQFTSNLCYSVLIASFLSYDAIIRSQLSSGSMSDCSARGPGIELRCGQLCLSHNHCDLQPWARAVCTLPAVPRSTQPSTLRGTVNEYQLSGWVIIINGDGGCRR